MPEHGARDWNQNLEAEPGASCSAVDQQLVYNRVALPSLHFVLELGKLIIQFICCPGLQNNLLNTRASALIGIPIQIRI